MRSVGGLILCWLLSGCASLSMQVPTARLETSETRGKAGAIQLFGGLESSAQMVITDDASVRPPVFATGRPSTSYGFAGGASLAVLPWLDTTARLSLATSSPMSLGLKAQLVGDPSLTAKAGSFSLAAGATLGYSSNHNGGSQKGLWGPGGYPWAAHANSSSGELSLLAGYRLKDALLLFGGLNYAHLNLKAAIDQDRSNDGTSPEAHYVLEGPGTSWSSGVGLQYWFNRSGYISGQAGYVQIAWPQKDIYSDVFVGLHVGVWVNDL